MEINTSLQFGPRIGISWLLPELSARERRQITPHNSHILSCLHVVREVIVAKFSLQPQPRILSSNTVILKLQNVVAPVPVRVADVVVVAITSSSEQERVYIPVVRETNTRLQLSIYVHLLVHIPDKVCSSRMCYLSLAINLFYRLATYF